MIHDRDYYRSLSVEGLLTLAREEGINEEMAIALAEALALDALDVDWHGKFSFNKKENV